eukprot:gene9562-biopygen9207
MLSGARLFFEGFPQGTVLGPVFWDLFMDDLVECLRAGLPGDVQVEVVLYADDVTALLRGPKLGQLYSCAQRVLDNLAGWESRNDAQVSLDKTTVTVFTPRAKALREAERPKLSFPVSGRGRAEVTYEAEPKLLGLRYDERLTFGAHLTELRAKVAKRGQVVSRLSGTRWGCDHRTLRSTHLAYVQGKADYALAAFGPFVKPGQLDGLGAEQYFSACAISGCPRGTRAPVAMMEAGLRPIQVRVDSAAAVLHERCRRLPADNRARQVAERPEPAMPELPPGEREAPQRAREHNWRKRAKAVLGRASLSEAEPREPLATHSRAPPWGDWGDVEFRPELCRRVTKRDPPERLRAAALDTLAGLTPDLDGYTEGSVLHPREQRQGGGGYVLLDARRPEPAVHRGLCAAGERCTSYRAELAALCKLLDDMVAGRGAGGGAIGPDGGAGDARMGAAVEAVPGAPGARDGTVRAGARGAGEAGRGGRGSEGGG